MAGVLPVPPRLILPTLITLTGNFFGFNIFKSYNRFFILTKDQKNGNAGRSIYFIILLIILIL